MEFFQDLWEAAKLAGPFGTMLMLFMWWLERADRRALQKERDALLERVVVSVHSAGIAVSEATKVIERSLERLDRKRP